MKLNQLQRYALWGFLVSHLPNLIREHSVVYDFDKFCDGEYTEWRVMSCFGMAGKIWNVNDRIYITGYSPYEMPKKYYKGQQLIIEKWDKEIAELLATYAEL